MGCNKRRRTKTAPGVMIRGRVAKIRRKVGRGRKHMSKLKKLLEVQSNETFKAQIDVWIGSDGDG